MRTRLFRAVRRASQHPQPGALYVLRSHARAVVHTYRPERRTTYHVLQINKLLILPIRFACNSRHDT